MFPVAMNLKPGQKLINLDKMPFFGDIKPNQKMIDISKIPIFKNLSITPALDLSFQEPPLTNQGCP
jgi:hypothetical protein